ncbi:MAG TPA: hypothetical protein VF473_01340 [Cyclobacteriaceae bacterium]
MRKTILHKVQSVMLIVALAFGQVGVGFFHNKHDAHEKIVDFDQTVLVKHGEHCKVCSVDWIHAFLAAGFVAAPDTEKITVAPPVVCKSLINLSRPLTKDRAPPTFG